MKKAINNMMLFMKVDALINKIINFVDADGNISESDLRDSVASVFPDIPEEYLSMSFDDPLAMITPVLPEQAKFLPEYLNSKSKLLLEKKVNG